MTRHLPHPPRLRRIRAWVAALPSGVPTTLASVLAVAVIGPPLLMGSGMLVDAARHPLEPVGSDAIAASTRPQERPRAQPTVGSTERPAAGPADGPGDARAVEAATAAGPREPRPHSSEPDPRCPLTAGASQWGEGRPERADLPAGLACGLRRAVDAGSRASNHPGRHRGHDADREAGSRRAAEARRHHKDADPD